MKKPLKDAALASLGLVFFTIVRNNKIKLSSVDHVKLPLLPAAIISVTNPSLLNLVTHF